MAAGGAGVVANAGGASTPRKNCSRVPNERRKFRQRSISNCNCNCVTRVSYANVLQTFNM